MHFGSIPRVRWGVAHRAFARAEVVWLNDVVAMLERDPDVLRDLHVVADPTCIVRGTRVTVQHRPGTDGPTDTTLRRTPAVEAVPHGRGPEWPPRRTGPPPSPKSRARSRRAATCCGRLLARADDHGGHPHPPEQESRPPTCCTAARSSTPRCGARVRRLRTTAGLRRLRSGSPRTGTGATHAARPAPVVDALPPLACELLPGPHTPAAAMPPTARLAVPHGAAAPPGWPRGATVLESTVARHGADLVPVYR